MPPTTSKTICRPGSSGPSYATVNGDDILPDFAIGRLPAASFDEARVMVHKIVSYETGGVGVTRAPSFSSPMFPTERRGL